MLLQAQDTDVGATSFEDSNFLFRPLRGSGPEAMGTVKGNALAAGGYKTCDDPFVGNASSIRYALDRTLALALALLLCANSRSFTLTRVILFSRVVRSSSKPQ
jgi:hypothetical protein